jgi:hypothetical protein
MPSTGAWTTYRAVVDPPAGMKSLTLFLYADSDFPGQATIDDYADVRVYNLTTPSTHLFVRTTPVQSRSQPFIVDHVSYSTYWDGPPSTTHVVVDGMVNGWIGSTSRNASPPHYALAAIDTGAEIFSIVAISGLLGLIFGDTLRRRYRRSNAMHKQD